MLSGVGKMPVTAAYEAVQGIFKQFNQNAALL